MKSWTVTVTRFPFIIQGENQQQPANVFQDMLFVVFVVVVVVVVGGA
jgi:hypothetical protein